MSSANTLPTPDHGGPESRAHEPSMEEILASIRRIIADDQSLPGRQTGTTEFEPSPEPPVHVLRASYLAHTGSAHSGSISNDSVSDGSAVATHGDGNEDGAALAADQMTPYGDIAAPQFASPEGPGQRWAVDPAHGEEPHGAAAMEGRHASHAVARAAGPVPTAVRPDRAATAHHAAAPEDHERRLSFSADDGHAAPHAAEPSFDGDVARFAHAGEHFEAAAQDASDGQNAWDEHRAAQPDADEHAAHLFSEATDHSIASAFNMLAASRIADNSDELLALARDMIRPLLRSWIDENLPGMVERMVRAEIERVARGR